MFIVVTRRIEQVQPGAERSFSLEVARNIAAHWHRSSSRRRELPLDPQVDLRTAPGTPEDATLRRQARAVLGDILASIPEPLRAVFIHFEFDQMDMHEIGRHLGIPRGTVASRLRRARDHMKKNVAAIDLAWELGVDSAVRIDEPVPLRRKKLSALARALLESGASKSPSPATLAKTLAACLALRRGESSTR